MKAKMCILRDVVLGILFFSISFASAGNLDPSAPPSSGGTMKPLDQLEPRIPIPGTVSPVTALTLNQSGSYYLTGDRYCSGTGIIVNADDVTIDLMGYRLIGPGTSTYNGINITAQNNVEIRNGTIRDFYSGISESNSEADDYRIIDIRSVFNNRNGIYLNGHNHLVKNCTSSSNGISSDSTIYGIFVGTGCVVTGNAVCNNGSVASAAAPIYGIFSGNGCSVSNNMVYYNGFYASYQITGIKTGHGNLVEDNIVYNNGYYADLEVRGIDAGAGNTIIHNTVRYNGYVADDVFALVSSSGCTVSGNTIYYNGYNASGNVYGIYAGSSSTVISNTAYYNGYSAGGSVYGIYLGGYNLVDQNTAYYNGLGATPGINMNLTIATCVYGNNVAP